MNKTSVLDISWGTILKISIVVVCFYILYLIKDLLIWFLFALIISILFNPAIGFLCKRKIPRVPAVIFVYLGIFGLLSLLIYSIAPLFISEIKQFAQVFPQYFEKASPILRGLGLQTFGTFESFINALGENLEKITTNVLSTFFAIFGGIFSTIFIITVAIFLSLEEKAMERGINLLFPKKYEAYALNLWARCQKKVSGWFGAKFLGCLFVGVASYFAFSLFNVKYSLNFALLAGILNFIVIVGPLITGVIIFLFVALSSLLKAIFVILVFTLIQLIEGNVFVPVLTKKFIDLPPALVLVALAIGGKLWGVPGAILCIPLAGILFEFLRDFLRQRKEEKAVTL